MNKTISVLIPVYNGEKTIRATLESVLRQTKAPDEVLVINDGSTDGTAIVLKEYASRITVLNQANAGVSAARNAMIARAKGELIAFVDSDDIWHPRYLEVQSRLLQRFPQAVASFVDHINFTGMGECSPDSMLENAPIVDDRIRVEQFEPLAFFRQFRKEPGPFVMSFCCMPKQTLTSMGAEPFRLRLAEDVYFCYLLPFRGPVLFASSPALAAYRIREGSLASDRLACTAGEVEAFDLLKPYYNEAGNPELLAEFYRAFASTRRGLAKILLGAGDSVEARRQLRASLVDALEAPSLAKSLALLLMSYLPKPLQPAWPPLFRQWQPAQKAD